MEDVGLSCGSASDAAHQAAALGTDGEGMVRRVRLGLAVCGRRCSVSAVLAGLRFKQIPEAREIEAAIAFGEESVMTDAMPRPSGDGHETQWVCFRSLGHAGGKVARDLLHFRRPSAARSTRQCSA